MRERYVYTKEQRVTKQIRALIWARDGAICQYCGKVAKPRYAGHYDLYVDHVVPAALGGPAEPHNLVLACIACNQLKARHVWVPRNLIAITTDNPIWRAKVLAMAAQDQHQEAERLTRNIGTTVTQAEREAFDWWVDHTGIPIGQLARAALKAYGILTMPEGESN